MALRRRRGFTLMEVLGASVCLGILSSAVLAGVRFATDRTAMARERAIVAEIAQSELETVRVAALAGTTPAAQTIRTVTAPGVPGDVTLTTNAVTGATSSLRELTTIATWNSRGARSLSFSGTALVQASTPAPFTLEVNPQGCFAWDSGSQGLIGSAPLVIDLQARGITPGMSVLLTRGGSFSFSGFSNQDWGMLAIFSSTNEVLSQNIRERVPGSIPSGVSPQFRSGQGYPNSQPVNTFQVSANFQPTDNSTLVTVPTGARFLIVQVADQMSFWDNNPWQGANPTITVTPQGATNQQGAAASLVVADSMLDYSDQSAKGWVYGRINDSERTSLNPTFTRLIRPGVSDAYSIDGLNTASSSAWVFIASNWVHPNGNIDRNPALLVAVRRWVSPRAYARLRVVATYRRWEVNQNGDGVQVIMVLPNGVVSSTDLTNTMVGQTVTQTQIVTNVTPGQIFDFRVSARGNAGSDATEQRIVISEE